MAYQGINTGTTPNDGTGDTLVAGGIKINSNFQEVYNLIGDGSTLAVGVVTVISAGTNVAVTTSTGSVQISAPTPVSIATTDVDISRNLNVSGISTFGIVTGATYYGDGSNLTGITTLISAGNNITVTTYAGITTISSTSGSGSTANINTDSLVVTGISTLGVVTGATYYGDGSNLTGLTGASEGTYGNSINSAQITVDGNGRITAISQVAISSAGGGGISGINVYDSQGLLGVTTNIKFVDNLDAVSVGNTIEINVTGVVTSLVGYATEGYVDTQVGLATAGLASETYVDNLVAISTFSGDYNDLTNTPTIPSDTGDLTNSVGFVTSSIVVGYSTEGYVDNLVAISTFSGDYNDLSNKPTIPSDTGDLTNSVGFVTSSIVVGYATEGYVDNLVAISTFSGDYGDLTNTPTIPSDTGDLTNSVGFVTSSIVVGYATEGYVDTQFLRSDVADTKSGITTFSDDVILQSNLNVTGVSTFNNNIDMEGDIIFGTQGDKLIFTSSNYPASGGSIEIATNGADYATIAGNSKQLRIYNDTDNTYSIDMRAGKYSWKDENSDYYALYSDGSVKLYHPGTSGGILEQKFETTSSGVTITGTLETQQLNVTGVSTIAQLNPLGITADIGTTNSRFRTAHLTNLFLSGNKQGTLTIGSAAWTFGRLSFSGSYTGAWLDLRTNNNQSYYISTPDNTSDTLNIKLPGTSPTANSLLVSEDAFGTLKWSNSPTLSNLNVSGVSTLGIVTGATYYGDSSYVTSGRWTLGADGTNHYTFTGIGFTQTTSDPVVYVARGSVYEFVNNSGGNHPFEIRVSNGGATYNNGVVGNGSTNGTVRFEVPFNAPNQLYYQCTNHSGMGGTMVVYPDLFTV